MENIFTLPIDQYKRQIDPINHYIEQAATYLSISKNIPLDIATNFVKSKLNKESLPQINNPTVTHTARQDNGDRNIVNTPLTNFISSSIKDKEIIAPTFTTYVSQDKYQSLLVDFIDQNVKDRYIAKNAMFVAKSNGDVLLEIIKNLEQTNAKLSNNALSGAHSSRGTFLYNKTCHSTLTSTCRITSGLGNANNEKLLRGNRHYWSPYIVLNNIVSIISHYDKKEMENVMFKYNLYYPTTQDCIDVILYSTNLYWIDNNEINKIKSFIDKLTNLDKAAFCYIGDLYHIGKYNKEFLKNIIFKLCKKINFDIKTDSDDIINADPIKYIKKDIPENIVILGHQICYDETKGRGKKYEEFPRNDLLTLCKTCQNTLSNILIFKDFFKVFLTSNNMPASLAHFPDSLRRCALVSDTDSTLFTLQYWISFCDLPLRVDQLARSVSSVMIFLTSENIVHILCMMSSNLGISLKRLKQITMKNEFYFDVLIPTNIAKHYFALISAQEGNIYKDYDVEIKGVHLKNSNLPKVINKQSKAFMIDIMKEAISGNGINLKDKLLRTKNIEKNIRLSLESGDPEFYKIGQIKQSTAYKTKPEQSPYFYHMFWNETFGKEFGIAAPPPYNVLKISTTLDNPTATKEWIKSIENNELRLNVLNFLNKYEKNVLPTIVVPMDIIKQKGLPKDILNAIDIRKIVFDLTGTFYIVLETLGVYLREDKMIRLVSDIY